MRTVCLRLFGLMLLLLSWPMRASAEVAPTPDYRFIEELRIHTEGDADPSAWQHQTEGQQAQAITKLKDFATVAQKTEHLKMRLVETSHFLIYTDNGIAANLVKEDGGYLETAYTGMNKVFNNKLGTGGQGSNIWQGKALVFIFSDNDIAEDFLRRVYHMNAAVSPMADIRSLPMVSLNNSGSVAIVAAQSDIFRNAKRDLVLAMADGYLFRLHSPTPIAPWVESGLVLAIADSIHYQSNQYTESDAEVARNIRVNTTFYLRNNDVNRLLGSPSPAPWACEGLVDYLIGQSPSRMAKFVLDMKDGKEWEDALKDIYQTSPSELKTAYLSSAEDVR
jgi:hypothetical protein